jgi:hypothetical protein
MTAILKYSPGEVLLMTSGEYSDYGHEGLIVVIKECDLRTLAQQCEDDKKNDWEDGARGFTGWLIAHGYAMPVDFQEVHVGTYGDWGDNFGVKKKEL